MRSESPAPIPDAPAELAAIEGQVTDHLFELMPAWAVLLGLHRYDGLLPDLDRERTESWAAGAERLRDRLAALAAEDLGAERALDRSLLTLCLESALFDLRDSREYDRNPMPYLGAVTLSPYLERAYAPMPQRVDAMVAALAAAPRLFAIAHARLDRVLPDPFVRIALQMAAGLPGHFREAEEAARRASPALGERIRSARGPAESALAELARRLKEEALPRATPDFALGPARFQRLLWVREGLRTPFAEIERMGRADLDRNRDRLASIVAAAGPTRSVDSFFETLYRDHPSAEAVLEETRRFVDETCAFVAEHDLVRIPGGAHCVVEPTPEYDRARFTAGMSAPGPYELTGTEGIYYVTPVDPAWSPERQQQWLRSLNRPMLRNITVHEVYPGHYLQALHARTGAASTARRVFASPSFVEGWAHYCEQLAVEQGLAGGAPSSEAAQLHDALMRDCRLLVAIGLHTGGLSLADAAELFRREAHLEALPAEREAIRGTFNPEYFCYTLGKLAILQARERHLEGRFAGSLRAFHDRLLAFGAPPIGLLDELLERAPDGAR